MKTRRDFTKPWLRNLPPVNKSKTPEPPYEVIEFPPQQQYSNTTFTSSRSRPDQTSSAEKEQNERKCDLCGSMSAQFQCNLCAGQTFCASCDLMYHRHPKRQSHIRQRMTSPHKGIVLDPPLPPKGELNTAPIPPPRRNRKSSRTTTANAQRESFKKDGSIMGSLKRLVVGGINSTSVHASATKKEHFPKSTSIGRTTDVDQQSSGKDSGYLDWDTRSNHHSVGFSAFNGPSFPALMQAHSMAHLGCPSCQVHDSAASNWNWNRSHMNLHDFGVWPANNLAGGRNLWHGSMILPSARRASKTSKHLPRQASLRSHRRGRAGHEYSGSGGSSSGGGGGGGSSDNSTPSDLSVSSDRRSKLSAPVRKQSSPAPSHRSYQTSAVTSDADAEDSSARHARPLHRHRPRRKTSVEPHRQHGSSSLARHSLKKQCICGGNNNEDAMSVKSSCSRRSSVKPSSNALFETGRKRRDSSSGSSRSADEFNDRNSKIKSSLGKPPLASSLARAAAAAAAAATISNNCETEAEDWQCQHCTYLNTKSSRVCDICCKSRTYTNDSKEAAIEQITKTTDKLDISSPSPPPPPPPAALSAQQRPRGELNLKLGSESPLNRISDTSTATTSSHAYTISTQTYEQPQKLLNRSLYKSSATDNLPSNSDKSASSQLEAEQDHHFEPVSDSNDTIKNQLKEHEYEIITLLKEAEKLNFSVEDLTIALSQCGETNPIDWLNQNWSKMIDTVVTLATNYGRGQIENTVGTISNKEAQTALHLHNGDMWAAATECIRQRQKKYEQLMSRGQFSREDVVTVLTANHGDLDAAYIELNRSSLKPFLMKIWGPPQGFDNESHPVASNAIENCQHVEEELQSAARKRSCDKELPPELPCDGWANTVRKADYYTSCDNLTFAHDLGQPKISQSLESLFGQNPQDRSDHDCGPSDGSVNCQKTKIKGSGSTTSENYYSADEHTDSRLTNATSKKFYLNQKLNRVDNSTSYVVAPLVSRSPNIWPGPDTDDDEAEASATTGRQDSFADVNALYMLAMNQLDHLIIRKKDPQPKLSATGLGPLTNAANQNADPDDIENTCDNISDYETDSLVETSLSSDSQDKINGLEIPPKETLLIGGRNEDRNYAELERSENERELAAEMHRNRVEVANTGVEYSDQGQSDQTSDANLDSIRRRLNFICENEQEMANESECAEAGVDMPAISPADGHFSRSTNVSFENQTDQDSSGDDRRGNSSVFDQMPINALDELKIDPLLKLDEEIEKNNLFEPTNYESDFRVEIHVPAQPLFETNKASGNQTATGTDDKINTNDLENDQIIKTDAEHCLLPAIVADDHLQDRIQEYFSDGSVNSYAQAELAVQLMDLNFNKTQSLEAAIECSDINSAIAYLQQECLLCAEKFSMKEMLSMLECEHQCCRECAQLFFSVQVNENSIDDCVCPFCQKPDVRNLDADASFDYFSNLDILLKSILKPHTHELFQQKLRDRTLTQDPHFRWCPQCSFGFIAETTAKCITCPSCKGVSCGQCGKKWQKEHETRTCEQYGLWLRYETDDPSFELNTFLEECGITCPQCATKFVLVKGGCMHMTCSRCKFEFCSDCQKQFSMGSNCTVSDYCSKLGLHAHHPRNCLFYLRDKEPAELKKLLIENDVHIKLQPSSNAHCSVQLQRETDDGFVDVQCGARVEEAGLCKCHLREFFSRIITVRKLETIDLLNVDDLETLVMREGKQRPPRGYQTPQQEYYEKLIHYVEYLAKLIRQNRIDPVTIFELGEILQEFRRRGKSLPIRRANIFEHEYRRYCIQVVKDELPLD